MPPATHAPNPVLLPAVVTAVETGLGPADAGSKDVTVNDKANDKIVIFFSTFRPPIPEISQKPG